MSNNFSTSKDEEGDKTKSSPSSTSYELRVTSYDATGQRLDIFCVTNMPGFTRGAIQKAIKAGQITVNGQTVKPRYLLKQDDVVSAVVSPLPGQGEGEGEGRNNEAMEQYDNIEILFESKDVVVINKPPSLLVHPGIMAASPSSATLRGLALGEVAAIPPSSTSYELPVTSYSVSSWFANRYPDSRDVGEDPQRPGIVHRLDKDTSGVLILAKTQKAYLHLKSQFKNRRAKKEYLALVFGVPGEPKGRITRPLARSRQNPMRRTVDIEGKEAVTEWRKEKKLGKYALLRVYPLTGRTHQIRVHMHFLGFPIVGDQLYVFKRQKPPQGVKRQMLHAEILTIDLPEGGKRTFIAPMPEDMQSVIEGISEK